MARARMLSRSLGTSRRFNALYHDADDIAEFAQLIFTLLIPHVDDYGRMAGDPQTVKLAVLPGSARTLDEFTRALEALSSVQLIQVYRYKTDDIWLEVNKFEEHQRGLSKRTDSKIPPAKQGVPVNFTEIREIIPSRARAELRTKNLELGTENLELKEQNKLITSVVAAKGGVGGNGTNGTNNALTKTVGRSKRPIYQSDRFVVFEWQLDGLRRLLGEHTEDFDLHAFFDSLTQDSRTKNLVIPQRDGGEWLQAQVLAEAKRRKLPIADAKPVSNKRVAGLVAGGENFLKGRR